MTCEVFLKNRHYPFAFSTAARFFILLLFVENCNVELARNPSERLKDVICEKEYQFSFSK